MSPHSPSSSKVAGTILTISLLCAHALAQDNTLLIIGDDIGVEAIACYGEDDSATPTPNISALAAGGVLFRNAYAAPLCSPTRAQIHTGRYGFRTGVGAPGHTMKEEEITLPEILEKAGYATALIGKWHLAGRGSSPEHPNKAGWSHFSGSLGGVLRPPDTYFRWNKTVNGKMQSCEVYATSENVNDALLWIGEQKKPWVCIVNFNSAHSPLHPPPEELYASDVEPEGSEGMFKAMIESMDTEIGRLLASMDPQARAKTNVIFLGDNGTPRNVISRNSPNKAAKGSLYEGGTNVPLIISGPAVTDPGREVSALVHVVDLFHTIAKLSGIDARAAVPEKVLLDGISFASCLASSKSQGSRKTLYTEVFGTTQSGFAIRDKRYKLIRRGGAEEFYDLEQDPGENRSLRREELSGEAKNRYYDLAIELLDLEMQGNVTAHENAPGIRRRRRR